jgi:hypothetical protein
MANPEKSDYHSFLLRVWRVKENDEEGYRATLEHVDTGERRVHIDPFTRGGSEDAGLRGALRPETRINFIQRP